MKLPNPKKLFKNEFDEEYQALIEQLAEVINYNFERTFSVLNKNVSLSDNTASFTKEIEVVVDSNGIPTTSIQVPSSLTPARPTGTHVLEATNLTDSTTYPTGYPFISYSELNGMITIKHITGLQSNNKYRLKVVFFA